MGSHDTQQHRVSDCRFKCLTASDVFALQCLGVPPPAVAAELPHPRPWPLHQHPLNCKLLGRAGHVRAMS